MKKSVNKLALRSETARVLHESELTYVMGRGDDKVVTGVYAGCLVKARSEDSAEIK